MRKVRICQTDNLMDHLLFICTGNYYRSRFAEAVFNYHAAKHNLNWQAFSRGLATHLSPDDGLSVDTHNALLDRGIPLDYTAADKASVTEDDLRRATRRIALLESGHRPYIRSLFPGWEEKVEYWQAQDLDVAEADVVLPEIEAKVIALVRELAKKQR
jgi:protein-tyrosine phosphatase